MLAIRLQRTGRSGHAMFRVIVQDSRFAPTSGKVVAYVGHYDPHAKTVSFDKDKIASYLANGAQPSPRLAKMLQSEGVKLPDWVELPRELKREVRNPDKRRSTRPEELAEAAPKEETKAAEPEAAEEPAKDEVTEPPAEEAKTEAEKPAEEPVAEETETETKAEPEKADEQPAAEESKASEETEPAEKTDKSVDQKG